jgi:uncharacterized tellurite resistance protein B-like protein
MSLLESPSPPTGLIIGTRSRRKRGKNNLLYVPVLIGGGVLALWENEGRFDYAEAAADARAIQTASDARGDEPISLTGPLSPSGTLTPPYLESLTGWHQVVANAEIYCWGDESDDDEPADMELDWRSSVGGWKENEGVTQRLRSGIARLAPVVVGETTVEPANLKLVDKGQALDLTSLALSKEAEELGLVRVGNKLVSRLQALDNPKLGDERVSYRATPAAATVTYFGSIQDGKGHLLDFAIERSIISGLIGNDGLLHHLVNGERAEAVQKMKANFSALKWRVRGFGILALIGGIFIALSTVASLTYMIPVIGDLAQGAVLVTSVVVGGAVGLLVILSSALFHHPIGLVIPLCGLAAVALYMKSLKGNASRNVRRRRSATSNPTSSAPGESSGGPFPHRDQAALEALVHVAMSDGDISKRERGFLDQWAAAAGIDQDTLEQMIEMEDAGGATHELAGREDLVDLIELALADGSLSSKEIKLLRRLAASIDIGAREFRDLVREVVAAAPVEPVSA